MSVLKELINANNSLSQGKPTKVTSRAKVRAGSTLLGRIDDQEIDAMWGVVKSAVTKGFKDLQTKTNHKLTYKLQIGRINEDGGKLKCPYIVKLETPVVKDADNVLNALTDTFVKCMRAHFGTGVKVSSITTRENVPRSGVMFVELSIEVYTKSRVHTPWSLQSRCVGVIPKSRTRVTSARMPYFKDVRDAYKTMLNALDALEDVEDLILKSQDARSAEDHTKISDIIHNIANETNRLLSIG